MARLVILDGMSWIHRAAHVRTRRRHELIFLDMIKALVGRLRPDFFLGALDGSREDLHRRAIWPKYKSSRPQAPSDLRETLDNCVAVLKATGVQTLKIHKWEADDIIATVAKICAGPNCEVVIVSLDKDLGQCCARHVRLWNGTDLLDCNAIERRWGVPPNMVPQLQALSGDTVDDIPGCVGIGKKIALEYIKRFGNLRAVVDNRDRLTPAKKKALEVFDWKLHLELVTLRTDLKIPLKRKDLIWTGINVHAVGQTLSALGL